MKLCSTTGFRPCSNPGYAQIEKKWYCRHHFKKEADSLKRTTDLTEKTLSSLKKKIADIEDSERECTKDFKEKIWDLGTFDLCRFLVQADAQIEKETGLSLKNILTKLIDEHKIYLNTLDCHPDGFGGSDY